MAEDAACFRHVVVGRQQDQGYRGAGEMPGVLAQVAQALLDCLVCDDPESPGLAVPGRSSPPGNVEDLVDLLTGHRPVAEVTDRTDRGQELQQQGHSRSLHPAPGAERTAAQGRRLVFDVQQIRTPRITFSITFDSRSETESQLPFVRKVTG